MILNNNLIFQTVYAELIYRLRLNLGISFLKLIKLIKNKSSKISLILKNLEDIKYKGYSHNHNYLTNKEIDFIESITLEIGRKIINNNFKDDTLGIEKIDGSLKIKNLSLSYKEIKRYASDDFYKFISFIFNLDIAPPVEIFNFSNDGSQNDYNLRGKCADNIASHPHRDLKNGKRHWLKAVILLDDVNESNGPTKLIPKTSSMLKFGTTVDFSIDDKKIKNLMEKNKVKNFVGKKGDMIIFDSSNIHWASNLRYGNRKLLWLYF